MGGVAPVQPSPFLPLVGDDDELMHSSLFYACLQRFLQAGDLLVADTGSCLLQLNAHRLPAAVAMESQTLWGSIGWGTPATLGCALAEPERRVVLVAVMARISSRSRTWVMHTAGHDRS